MAFAQLTYRDSLRDIEACLRSMQDKRYHMGFRGKVSRSTLADANESRDCRIYADFARVLIGMARPLYAHDPMGVDLEHSLYALDSTTIDLCLSLFPWARFRQHKAAVKMHTLLDLNIPTFIRITDGKVHDVNILDEIVPEDRGMLRHGSRLHQFRPPLLFHSLLGMLRRAHQRECPSATALLAYGRQKYRCALRSHRHPNRHRICQSLSGCIATGKLPGCGHQRASEVSGQQLCSSSSDYRPNLQMPMASGTFFRWVKQHLRIKSFSVPATTQ
jgi:uncharacterized protein DUF4372